MTKYKVKLISCPSVLLKNRQKLVKTFPTFPCIVAAMQMKFQAQMHISENNNFLKWFSSCL